MPGLVYILCALTSLACSAMLLRGYRQSGVRLLLWSGLCFLGLALDNVILYVDLFVWPDVNMAAFRRLPGLFSLMLLIFGLVWETK